jgi:hypothetical protein
MASADWQRNSTSWTWLRLATFGNEAAGNNTMHNREFAKTPETPIRAGNTRKIRHRTR